MPIAKRIGTDLTLHMQRLFQDYMHQVRFSMIFYVESTHMVKFPTLEYATK